MLSFMLPEPTRYLSPRDETNFFKWLQRIPIVSQVKGGYDDLKVDLKTKEIDDRSADEFVALFARYDLAAELPGARHKGKTVAVARRVDPASVTLTKRGSDGFFLSISPSLISRLDERGFNDWLKGIQPNYAGLEQNGTASLELEPDDVTDINVYDLIGLLTRYRLDLSKLKPLCELADPDYFGRTDARWYEDIYGTPSSS